jgi:hypothetical protein
MNLIGEGLGLKYGYFDNDLTGSILLSVNHYPSCSEPSLTLGITKHSDPNLITILLQDDVSGLQVFKDGEWIAVEALPHAFVINVGYQLQVRYHHTRDQRFLHQLLATPIRFLIGPPNIYIRAPSLIVLDAIIVSAAETLEHAQLQSKVSHTHTHTHTIEQNCSMVL